MFCSWNIKMNCNKQFLMSCYQFVDYKIQFIENIFIKIPKYVLQYNWDQNNLDIDWFTFVFYVYLFQIDFKIVHLFLFEEFNLFNIFNSLCDLYREFCIHKCHNCRVNYILIIKLSLLFFIYCSPKWFLVLFSHIQASEP